MRLNNGFLLIEVLVALGVFCVMVGAFGWFINVWLTSDADQRARNRALVQVCEVLERSAVGLGVENQEPMIKARQSSAVQQLSVKQIWAVVPQWVGQLQEEECPRGYRVTVAAKGQNVTVRVNG